MISEFRSKIRSNINILDLIPSQGFRNRIGRQFRRNAATGPFQTIVMKHNANTVLCLSAVALDGRAVLPTPPKGLKRVVRSFQCTAAAMNMADEQPLRPIPFGRSSHATAGQHEDGRQNQCQN